MYYRGIFMAHRASRLALAALFVIAAYWCLRLAWADYLFRTGVRANRERAAALIPFRAEYQAAIGNWRRAVELNDYFSKGWIELALAAEGAGDYATAERHLLKAASVDQLFEPRWALANFYVRRNRPEEFWKWVRLAAERSYGDRTGLFRLTTRMSNHPQEIAERVFPRDNLLRQEFAAFLVEQGNLEAAGAIAATLTVTDGNREWMLTLCDKLIHAGRAKAAVGLWQRAAGGGEAASLVNASLEKQPVSKGFDWRIHWREGVSTVWSPGRLRIRLTGKQAETVDLVSQYVWIEEAGVYRFRFRYRTEGLAANSGVRWRVAGAQTPAQAYLSSGEEQQATVEFRVLEGGRIVRLDLMYERAPGTVRQEGTVLLEGGMSIERAS